VAGAVVKRSRSFVEASGKPGIRKLKMLKVEMVAAFVARVPNEVTSFFTAVRIRTRMAMVVGS